MIALDTNVLARYLLTDDRKQAKIATSAAGRAGTVYGAAYCHS